MIRVKATREGLVGGRTASGYVVDKVVPFVALPSTKALGKFVKIHNPKNGRFTIAIVLDVGPWNGGKIRRKGTLINTDDDPYVFKNARPQAETGVDGRGRKTNGAGIDLGEKVWKELGMKDNTDVEWEFLVV
jgi:hypothetical protein